LSNEGAVGAGQGGSAPVEGASTFRSGASKRLALGFILGFPVLLFVLAAARGVELAAESEVPAAWRDLDCDGSVSRIEWLRGGLDFRLRASAALPGCTELVHAKAGYVAVVRCPVAPLCRR
jgi:hypothetical protein